MKIKLSELKNIIHTEIHYYICESQEQNEFIRTTIDKLKKGDVVVNIDTGFTTTVIGYPQRSRKKGYFVVNVEPNKLFQAGLMSGHPSNAIYIKKHL